MYEKVGGGGWKNNPGDRTTKNTGGRGGGLRLKKISRGGGKEAESKIEVPRDVRNSKGP